VTQGTPYTKADEDAVRAELAEAFRKAAAKGHPKLLTPLPWRVRLRLWLTRRVDGAAIWLVEHGRFRAAIGVWRACRLW
jgi:hypothetical protein